MFPRWWWRSGTLFVPQSYTMLFWKSLVIKLSDVNVRGHLQLSWCVFDAFFCFSGALTEPLCSFPFFSITHFLYNSFPLSPPSPFFLPFFLYPSGLFQFYSLSVCLSSCCLTLSLFFWLHLRMPLSLSLCLVLRLSLSLSLWLSLSSSPFFSTSDSLALYFNLSLRLLSHSFFFCLNIQIFSVCLRPSSRVLPFLSLSVLSGSTSRSGCCVSLSFFTSLSVSPLLQLSFQ